MNPFQRCGRKIVKTHARKNVRRDVFERCMMYDMDKAIPQRWSSSNQHPMSQLPDVTTGVAWTLFTVWTWVTSPFSPTSWLVDSLLQVAEVVDIWWEKWFYVQHHPYVYYIQVIYCKDSTCYLCVYHLFTIPAYTACCFLASLGSSSRDILVDEKTRRALRIEICRVLWGKDRHEFVDVHICLYICFV